MKSDLNTRKNIIVIEAISLLSSQIYNETNMINAAKNLLFVKKTNKAVYSEVFFLNKQAVIARKKFEIAKRTNSKIDEEIKTITADLIYYGSIKRLTSEGIEKQKNAKRNLVELEKEKTKNNIIINQWRLKIYE